MKIAIDPGHGMSNKRPGIYDTGATHTEGTTTYQEADIALRYGLSLKDVLRERQVEVFMTRDDATDDAPVSQRAGNAERAGCDKYVALHLNDDDNDNANGLEVLYRDAPDKPLAEAMQRALVRATGLKDRGVKQRPDLAVLKFDGPAILIELGFIANDSDRTTLLNPQVRAAVCTTIADVLLTETKSILPPKRALAARQLASSAYQLPAYARAEFGEGSGIPWESAKIITSQNFYEGLVANSFQCFATGELFYESKFAIDGDGSGGNDEDDEHFKGDSSLHNAEGRALNSRHYPFIVLPLPHPRAQWEELGVGLGDLGICFFKHGASCPVLYGDQGPNWRIGEGSMFAAKSLGINADPNVGGIDAGEIPPGILHFIFPKSRRLVSGHHEPPRTTDTPESIAARANELFAALKAGRGARRTKPRS